MLSIDEWLTLTQDYYRTKEQIVKTLKGMGLDLNSFVVLYYLSQADGKCLRQKQLEEKFCLSQSALSRLIQRLAAHSCQVIEIRPCTIDQRSSSICLTSKGEELLQEATPLIEEILKHYPQH